MDKGEAGIDSTLNALDAAGVGHAGMARTPAGGRSSAVRRPAARPWPTCPTRSGSTAGACPRDRPWRSNLIDPARIVAEAQQARARRGPVRGRVAALGGRGLQRRHLRPAAGGRGDHGQRRRRRDRRAPRPRRPADRAGQRALGGVRPGQLPRPHGRVEPVLWDSWPGRDDGAAASHRAARRLVRGRAHPRPSPPTSTAPATSSCPCSSAWATPASSGIVGAEGLTDIPRADRVRRRPLPRRQLTIRRQHLSGRGADVR